MTTSTRRVFCAACLAAVWAGACTRPTEIARAEPEGLNVTDWTEKTELYMEYPPLVAGHPAVFAVHLTKLDDFKPVTAGRASVEFTPEGGGQPSTTTPTPRC